jgi:hypothetical protein
LGSFDAVFVPVLITEDFLRIQNFSPWGESVATDTFSVSKESDSVLGPVEVKKIFTQIERNLVNTAYPYLGWLMWASLLPCLLVLSTVVNLLYFALFRFKLPWQESIRILCIALTPGIVFLESLYFFQYFNQKWVLFGFAVIVGYYLLGVRARHIDIGLVKR